MVTVFTSLRLAIPMPSKLHCTRPRLMTYVYSYSVFTSYSYHRAILQPTEPPYILLNMRHRLVPIALVIQIIYASRVQLKTPS